MKIPRFSSLFSVLLAFARSLILKLAVRCVCFMIVSWKLWPWWNWQINRDGSVLSLRGASRVPVSAGKATTVLVSFAVVFRLVTQRCVTNLKTIAKETTTVGAQKYIIGLCTLQFFCVILPFFFRCGLVLVILFDTWSLAFLRQNRWKEIFTLILLLVLLRQELKSCLLLEHQVALLSFLSSHYMRTFYQLVSSYWQKQNDVIFHYQPSSTWPNIYRIYSLKRRGQRFK